MTPLPDFDLAPLRKFDPRTFTSSTPSVDAFVLSLALAYNDLKDLEWIAWQLKKGEPEKQGISEYNGQFYGFRIHITRLTLAFLHEVMIAIDAASKEAVLSDSEFVKVLGFLTKDARKAWDSVSAVATGENASKTDSEFLGFLAKVRNSAAYHYYQPKGLHKGYVRFFDQTTITPNNEAVYASLGSTLEQTRFYFADAAIGEWYDDRELVNRAGELRSEVNRILRWLVEAFLIKREKDLGAEAATARAKSV